MGEIDSEWLQLLFWLGVIVVLVVFVLWWQETTRITCPDGYVATYVRGWICTIAPVRP
jgi:hypothetical protein